MVKGSKGGTLSDLLEPVSQLLDRPRFNRLLRLRRHFEDTRQQDAVETV